MKRLCLILVLVVGCAGPRLNVIQSPAHTSKIMPSVHLVQKCMEVPALPVYIVDSTTPNAFCDGEAIYFTTALIDFIDADFVTFVAAHELAHHKLGHIKKLAFVTYGITGLMLASNLIIPGAGYLNLVVNPAISNNFSKLQEHEADKFAVDSLSQCKILTAEQSVKLFEKYSPMISGGGFWSTHPNVKDRIENLKRPY